MSSCAHHDLSVYVAGGGWPSDTEVAKGQCRNPDCGLWIARETNLANGEITDRVLTTAEISTLKLLYGGQAA